MQNKSFEALWKHYVPRDGAPRNVQGEVLRAIARISHEVRINECANWSADFDDACELIRSRLSESGFDAAAMAATAQQLERVRSLARSAPAHEDLGSALTRIRESVVAWCNQKLAEQTREA